MHGKGSSIRPKCSLVDSLNNIMAQVEAKLELVLGVEFVMSPGREASPSISPSLDDRLEAFGLDEGELEVTLDPAFLETPLISPTEPSVPFDGSGEASLVVAMLPCQRSLCLLRQLLLPLLQL